MYIVLVTYNTIVNIWKQLKKQGVIKGVMVSFSSLRLTMTAVSPVAGKSVEACSRAPLLQPEEARNMYIVE